MTSKVIGSLKGLFYGSQIPMDSALPMNMQNTGKYTRQGAVEHPA